MKKLKLFLKNIIVEAIEKAIPKKDILETLIENVVAETNIKFDGIKEPVNFYIIDSRCMSRNKFHDRMSYFQHKKSIGEWYELCSSTIFTSNGEICVFSYAEVDSEKENTSI
ncbi:hypothetical protein BPT24_249 [Tenacibaculum phage pT24]|uniref:Uncharacterized protein n=1 Tax=Tenacibaculum phage pT24 TaxID=1880590 RepID=A0A1B4XX38_9CAUD|nr:hypothetical protein HYP10_gp279 [Tenacibaculum phage pT24]BAV39369.1 hypothetical protein BPT24_249 [Tenacibaculum phage pT24]